MSLKAGCKTCRKENRVVAATLKREARRNDQPMYTLAQKAPRQWPVAALREKKNLWKRYRMLTI